MEGIRDENGEVVAEIRKGVENELGIPAINAKIQQAKEQVELLEQAKEKLGIGQYGNLEDGSKAQLLIDKRAGQKDRREQTLRRDRDQLLSKIWLAQTVDEAQRLLNEIPTTYRRKGKAPSSKVR